MVRTWAELEGLAFTATVEQHIARR